MANKKTKKTLTDKEEAFCQNYCIHLNGSRAVIEAGYNVSQPNTYGTELRQKEHIKKRIEEIRGDTAKAAGITRLGIALELKKMAFSSMADYYDQWGDLKPFDELTPFQKACLAEIKVTEKTYGEVTDKFSQIKLHDKAKALDQLIKMFGYNEPEEMNLNQNFNIPITEWVKSSEGDEN